MALAPKQVRAHEGLFNLCINSRRPDRALEVLKTLADQAELTDVQRTFVVAQGLARISQLVEVPKRSEYVTSAIKYCREARKLDPQWGDVQIFLADLLMRDEATTGEAEALLREMLQNNIEAQRARRMLANLLAAAPNRARFQEALQLLDQGGEQGSPPDQRTKIEVLVRSGGEPNLAAARQSLERLVRETPTPADADRLLLAELCQYAGDIPAAIEQYKSLVGRDPPATGHLAQFIELLVNTRDFAAAETYLKQLEQRSPDTFESVRLRPSGTRARATPRRSNRLSKAMLSGSSSRSKTTHGDGPSWPGLSAACTRLSASTSQRTRWYASLVQLEPSGYPDLAVSLARQGDVKGAINVCLEAAKTDATARPAAAVASALLEAKPTAEEFQAAEPLLSEAEKKYPQDSQLLFILATLRYVQERFPEAANLYRRVIELTPNNVPR